MINNLYKKYLSLKIDNSNYFYLFKTKNFYIFISNDARIIAPLLNLELTKLNSVILKCEFPINSSEKYLKKIEQLELKIQIVILEDDNFDYHFGKSLTSENFIEYIDNFLDINIDDLSSQKAFELLKNLQDEFKYFKKNL